MKNRDKILDYFDNVADGTIVSANDMYEHGFVRMNQEAFFRVFTWPIRICSLPCIAV